MARKPARGARYEPSSASRGHPNVPLVIVMVFMILVSLVLGYFLYDARTKIKDANDKRDQAVADMNNAQKDLDAAEEDRKDVQEWTDLKFRSWLSPDTMGDPDWKRLVAVTQSFESGKALSGRPRKDPRPEKLMTLVKKVEGDRDPKVKDAATRNGLIGPYDPKTGRIANALPVGGPGELHVVLVDKNDPTKNISRMPLRLKNLEEDFKKLNDDLIAAQQELGEYKDGKRFNADVFKKKLDELRAELNRQHANEMAAAAQNLQKELDSIKESLNKDLTKIITDEQAKVGIEIQQLRERFDQEIKKLDQLRVELDTKAKTRNVIHFDEPRGTITKTEPNGQTVYIDIGSDQRAREQLTFSVYGKGPGGKAEADPKATIEIVRVLDKRLSLARVTKMAKPASGREGDLEFYEARGRGDDFWVRDPRDFWKTRAVLQPGDLLYNPLWDPNRKVHVFLAGIFDLDNDGQDDAEIFIKMLKEMGAEIDGYLDPKNEWKVNTGGKLDYQTEYLIVGSMVPAGAANNAATLAAFTKLTEEATAYENMALARAIDVVTLRRFLTRMGYNVDRIPTGRAAGNAAPAPAPMAPAVAPN